MSFLRNSITDSALTSSSINDWAASKDIGQALSTSLKQAIAGLTVSACLYNLPSARLHLTLLCLALMF